MSKKLLVTFIILSLISLTAVYTIQSNNYDFEGLFSMNVPFGKEYEDIAYCFPNGRLGCAKEYWDVSSGCQMSENEIVIFYYDDSYLVDGETNTLNHAINTLTTSYFYEFLPREDNLMILTTDIGLKDMPPYLVGVVNNDKTEVVFVGGYHLNELKNYANSIKFN